MDPVKAVSPVMLFMRLTQDLQVSVSEAMKASRLPEALGHVFANSPLLHQRGADGRAKDCLLLSPSYGADAIPLGTLWLERASSARPQEVAYTFGFGGPDVPQTGACHPSVAQRFELLSLHQGAEGAGRLEVKTDRLSVAQMPLRYRLYLMDKALGSPRLSPCLRTGSQLLQ